MATATKNRNSLLRRNKTKSHQDVESGISSNKEEIYAALRSKMAQSIRDERMAKIKREAIRMI